MAGRLLAGQNVKLRSRDYWVQKKSTQLHIAGTVSGFTQHGQHTNLLLTKKRHAIIGVSDHTLNRWCRYTEDDVWLLRDLWLGPVAQPFTPCCWKRRSDSPPLRSMVENIQTQVPHSSSHSHGAFLNSCILPAPSQLGLQSPSAHSEQIIDCLQVLQTSSRVSGMGGNDALYNSIHPLNRSTQQSR